MMLVGHCSGPATANELVRATPLVDSLDREARRMGVTRQSLIKLWLAERLGQPNTAGNRRGS
jgi:hypothetical protein